MDVIWSPMRMLQTLQLLLPQLLSLSLGIPPGRLCSSPVPGPLQLPLAQLGLPVTLGLFQSALPLLV